MTLRHSVLAFCCLFLWNVAIAPAQASNHAEQKPDAADSKEQAPIASPTCILADDDYAVFTAVLERLENPEPPEPAWKNREMLVNDITGAGRMQEKQWSGWHYTAKSRVAPSAEVLLDYQVKSGFACPLIQGWGDSKLYRPFQHTELAKYFGKPQRGHDGWEEFYRAHPKTAGFWTFSRPGFNKNRTEALLYVTNSCGWLCGSGHIYFLTRESPSSKWTVTNRLLLWVA